MTPPPTPQIPGMEKIHSDLQDNSVITGKPEQFISSAGSGPPNLASMPQYAGLDIQPQPVRCTNFEAFDHSQLIANVDPIQAESISAFRQEWANASNTVTESFETFALKIGRAIAEKWTGPAGEAASKAILSYAQSSVGMADASNLIARQVGLLTDSLDRTKSNFPAEPAATVPGKVLGFFGADGWDDERREAAKQQAVQLLNTVYYSGGISPTAESMPVFPAVQSPVSDSGEPSGNYPTGGPTGGPTSSAMAGDGGGGTPVSPSADRGAPTQAGTPTVDGSEAAAATNAAAAPGTPGSEALRGLGSLESPFKPPASTQAAGISGIGGGVGGGIGGLGSGIGGGGIGGGIGAGASTANPASPTPGGGVAGGAVSGGARPAVAGQSGMRGMGMAPMGGARGAGGGNDDDEHTTPDYLQNDELRQWVDAQADRGYAPVIGAQRPPRTDNAGSK